MPRLHLTVEGPTEQAFAAGVLTPYLAAKGVYLSKAQLVAHARKKGVEHRGGLRRYEPFRNDVVRRLKEDQSVDAFFSTMIDLYALPGDFPETDQARRESDPYCRIERLERALAEDIDDRRFVPHIQLHEFEALLLADPGKFSTYYSGRATEIEQLRQVAASEDSPELINDGQQTAPSKRIASLIPEYAGQKPAAGPIIAAAIGLETIRAKCPHFNAWLRRLEALGQSPV